MREVTTETPDPIAIGSPAVDFDAILAQYNKPYSETVVPTSQPNDANLLPWQTATMEQNRGEGGGPDSYRDTPPISVTHNPAGSIPEQRYYKSGPKKGLPRPPRKNEPIARPTTIQASAFLTGAILVTMIDLLLPMALAGLNNWRSKIKIKADDLKMTDKQKEEIRPIADAVLKELNVNASPSMLLGIMLVGIYATNLMLLRSDAETKMKIDEKNRSVPKTGNITTPSVNDVRRVPTSHY